MDICLHAQYGRTLSETKRELCTPQIETCCLACWKRVTKSSLNVVKFFSTYKWGKFSTVGVLQRGSHCCLKKALLHIRNVQKVTLLSWRGKWIPKFVRFRPFSRRLKAVCPSEARQKSINQRSSKSANLWVTQSESWPQPDWDALAWPREILQN